MMPPFDLAPSPTEIPRSPSAATPRAVGSRNDLLAVIAMLRRFQAASEEDQSDLDLAASLLEDVAGAWPDHGPELTPILGEFVDTSGRRRPFIFALPHLGDLGSAS